MAKKNIFLCDIELPEIVQEKADEAFSLIITEGKGTMKANNNLNKSGKPYRGKKDKSVHLNRTVNVVMAGAAAVAACALLFAGGIWISRNAGAPGEKAEAVLDTDAAENSDGTILEAFDKMFTLRVKAAESLTGGRQGQTGARQQEEQADGQYVALEAGRPVPLVTGNTSQSYVLGGDDVTGIAGYCINVPLSCEGEHIEKVSYSINKGAFQIVQAEGKSIIVSGEEYVEDDRINNMNCGSIGGNYSEETGVSEEPMETKFYKSFTLDYQKQSDEQTWINIVDNVPDSQEAIDLIWEQDSLQAFQSGLQKILDNTTITCTVEYADHTSQSVDIKVDSRVMTYREAGEPEASVKGDPDEETVYITFELQ